jgi:hypothetical protein
MKSSAEVMVPGFTDVRHATAPNVEPQKQNNLSDSKSNASSFLSQTCYCDEQVAP